MNDIRDCQAKPDPKYDILTADAIGDLIAQVNTSMAHGWRPYGDVVVTTYTETWNYGDGPETERTIQYLQAMTKGL